MLVLTVVAGGAILAGGIITLAARRWPRLHLSAPRVEPDDPIVREVDKHPGLAALLQREIDPVTATGLILTVATAVLVVGIVAFGLLLLMVRSHTGLAAWDLTFARWGADHATQLSTRVLSDISFLGSTMGVVAIAAVVGVLEYRRRPNRAIPGLLLLVVIGQSALNNVIKLAVRRDRPAIQQLIDPSGFSFPSGHAVAAAATFAGLAILLGRGRSRPVRNAVAGGAVAIAVLVAGSRVMLGVHWFTDVLAGLAVGWGWVALCSIAFGGRVLRFGQPVVVAEAAARAGGEADGGARP